MKKLLVSILVLAMAFGIVGCTGGYQQDTGTQQQNNANTFTSSKESEVIILTSDNIGDYLTFNCSITDVEKTHLWDRDYDASGQMTIKTSPRQRGDFEDVVLQVTIQSRTTNSGWSDGKRELVIPFDGKFEETFRYNSGVATYISTSPTFNIVVNSVTGKFVKG